jgi:hypothetical protein
MPGVSALESLWSNMEGFWHFSDLNGNLHNFIEEMDYRIEIILSKFFV